MAHRVEDKDHTLQLHHNFKWVLLTNHTEPVKGFLQRFLRRKFIDDQTNVGFEVQEARVEGHDRVVEWLAQVWRDVNKVLQTHCSSDVTIGEKSI